MPKGVFQRTPEHIEKSLECLRQWREKGGSTSKFSKEFRAVCIKRYLSGESARHIAKETGCNKETVRKWVKNTHGRNSLFRNRAIKEHLNKIEAINELERAYIAGLFDGEGSVCFVHPKDKTYPWLQINITSTYEPILAYLKSSLGGHISMTHKPTEKHKTCWAWRAYCRQAIHILQIILPHLKIKRVKAEEALHYFNGEP